MVDGKEFVLRDAARVIKIVVQWRKCRCSHYLQSQYFIDTIQQFVGVFFLE